MYGGISTAVDGSTGVVRAVAPLRISFAGGGTDVAPYPADHGGCVLSATIDAYAYASVRVRPDGDYAVRTDDEDDPTVFPNVEDLVFDGHLDLVKACLRRLVPSQGLELHLGSDAMPGTGLGSSSAMVVAMLAGVSAVSGQSRTRSELADLAYRVEREDLQQAGGMQDQYAAAFGGFNFIEFFADDRVVVNPMMLGPDVLHELHASLLLCDTGMRHKSGGILRRQVDNYVRSVPTTVRVLARIAELAVLMKERLLLGDLAGFAEGLDEGWHLKRDLAEGITNDTLDDLYEIAVKNGARGGKVLGAGGGGYLLLACEPERRADLGRAMRAAGAPVARFGWDTTGPQVWRT